MEETMLADEFSPDRFIDAGREEESLFARGDDDALIRYDKPTEDLFEKKVRLVIDGEFVEVPKAKKARDAQGNVSRDQKGNPIPRDTTIYDAAMMLVETGRIPLEELHKRIPLLCHQQHLDPVAVCRMCSVHVSGIKRDKFTPGRKLVPACQHRVEDRMAVLTQRCPEDKKESHRQAIAQHFDVPETDVPEKKRLNDSIQMIRNSTTFLGELLAADHLHPNPERDGRFLNELDRVVRDLEVGKPTRCSSGRAGPAGRNFDKSPKARPVEIDPKSEVADVKKFPYSSRSIQVNHDRCILCDRCSRSCSDVKPFKIIGHTGKGYRSRISFDLDALMDDSGCVQCGECMSSCPTGALTLNQRVVPQALRIELGIKSEKDPRLIELRIPETPLPDEYLTAKQMQELVIHCEVDGQKQDFYPFRDISFPYLRWNEGAVRRRKLTDGKVLCTEGEFGSSAFLLVEGEFDGEQRIVTEQDAAKPRGLLGRLGNSMRSAKKPEFYRFNMLARRDLILGEIACLTNSKRTATVKAKGPAVVVELSRNMLTMLQRNRSAREVLDRIYTRRAMRACLLKSEPFIGLPPAELLQVIDELQAQADVWRIEPGQTIIRENDSIGFDITKSSDDSRKFHGDFYIVMFGFVKVTQLRDGQERVLAHLSEGEPFGEIALLPDHPLVAEAREQFGINPFRRTATVTALSDVEVVRVPGDAFRRFFKPEMPIQGVNDPFAKIATKLAKTTVDRLREQSDPPRIEEDRKAEYLNQGLYQAQKMLVLDLTCCTRCDECTKACADAHGDGHSRLIREGLRFGDFLVAGSCRSCHQPYCMDGCPVDAIHRDKGSLEVLVDNHCIGCSLCERNCPYGSIQMVPKEGNKRWSDIFADIDTTTPQSIAAVERRAVNCDLCHDLVGPGRDPFCVSACPHKAAFRMSGDELLAEVNKRGA